MLQLQFVEAVNFHAEPLQAVPGAQLFAQGEFPSNSNNAVQKPPKWPLLSNPTPPICKAGRKVPSRATADIIQLVFQADGHLTSKLNCSCKAGGILSLCLSCLAGLISSGMACDSGVAVPQVQLWKTITGSVGRIEFVRL